MATSSRPTRLVVVANPDTPRWRCLAAEPAADLGVHVELLPWSALIAARGDLTTFDQLSEPATLRFESPGKNDGVIASILSFAGGEQHAELKPGELLPARQFYRGLGALFGNVEASLAQLTHVTPWTAPSSILAMLDKVETRRRLHDAGLPHPEGFEPGSYSQFEAELQHRRFRQAYLKLRHGSSGCGIVYVDGPARFGLSTVALSNGRFMNSRHLQHEDLANLRPIIERLITEGATCERAVPHAELHGARFDARLLVIDKRVPFVVFRKSPHPITNLELGGRRADEKRCRAWLGERLVCDAKEAALRATALLQAPVAGVDVVFDRSRQHFALLEVNAFGDFFPQLKDTRGRTVHRAVLEAVAQRTQTSAS